MTEPLLEMLTYLRGLTYSPSPQKICIKRPAIWRRHKVDSNKNHAEKVMWLSYYLIVVRMLRLFILLFNGGLFELSFAENLLLKYVEFTFQCKT